MVSKMNIEQNMAIWNAARSVPESAKKNFDNGSFKGTDINPCWRQQTMTSIFGPCGFGWSYEITEMRKEQVGNDIMTYCHINLYVKHPETGEWSRPIPGVGGNRQVQEFTKSTKISDEDEKMALTDALGVACKALGVGADVYLGQDSTKYTAYSPQPAQRRTRPAAQAKPEAPMKKIRFNGENWENALKCLSTGWTVEGLAGKYDIDMETYARLMDVEQSNK